MHTFTSASYLRQFENKLVAQYGESGASDFYSTFFSSNGSRSLFWKEIFNARSKFHRGDPADFSHIRPHILRSWKRSRAVNAPCAGMSSVLLSNEELEVILKRNDFLLSTAKPIMAELLENIKPSSNSIILTDTDGVFLQTLGDGRANGGSTCLLPGLLSGESIEGTTSMGICLVEKEPTCVLGCEHYNPYFDGWSCAAAPIFDYENNMVATISLTMNRESFNHHTYGLVIAAAKAITEQMRLRHLLQETQTIMELLGEAVVVLDANGCIRMMNRNAKQLFHVKEDVIGIDFNDIAITTGGQCFQAQDKKAKDNECIMRLTDGTMLQCLYSSSSTPEGGLCVTLRESRRVHKLTNRITRAKAVYTFSDIQGTSDQMRRALRMARKASENSMTTLILGESGVGKELFAQAIHNGGDRRDQPFIVINCGAIPRDLVQSELFGYEAGAFTGATRQGAPGKFELADGGTLFLDEIGDMPLSAQVSLLRVLQEGEVTRVGGKRPHRVNVRVVAATHRDLAKAVENGTFRHDLYYRLNVLVIKVPDLGERRSDIPVLANFFLSKIAKTLDKQLTGFSPESMKCLKAYNWPGNIRELENMVERTAVMADGPLINKEDLLPEFWTTVPQTPLEEKVSIPGNMAVEPESGPGKRPNQDKQRVVDALQKARGNVRAAAKDVGVSRVTLYAHIRRYGLSLESFRQQRQ